MVWDGGSEPPVVPTRWALLGVALGGAPVWPCGGGGRLRGGERRKASSVLPPTRSVEKRTKKRSLIIVPVTSPVAMLLVSFF